MGCCSLLLLYIIIKMFRLLYFRSFLVFCPSDGFSKWIIYLTCGDRLFSFYILEYLDFYYSSSSAPPGWPIELRINASKYTNQHSNTLNIWPYDYADKNNRNVDTGLNMNNVNNNSNFQEFRRMILTRLTLTI